MQLRMGLDSRLSSFDLRQKAVEGCETIINQATLLTWTESSVSYSCPPGIDCPGQLDAFHHFFSRILVPSCIWILLQRQLNFPAVINI